MIKVIKFENFNNFFKNFSETPSLGPIILNIYQII